MDIRGAFQLMVGFFHFFFKVDRDAGKSGQLPVPSELATPPRSAWRRSSKARTLNWTWTDVPACFSFHENIARNWRHARIHRIFQTQGGWKNGVTQHHWPQGARLLDNSIQPFDVQIWYLVLLQLPVFAWVFWGHHNLMYHPGQLSTSMSSTGTGNSHFAASSKTYKDSKT